MKEKNLYIVNALIIILTMGIIFGYVIIDKSVYIENLESELFKSRQGNFYEQHDPTFQEVEEFISQDTTDKLNYENETFTCKDFAQVVNNNAEKKGIRCAYVLLSFVGNVSHGIIGFNTTDNSDFDGII